MINYELEISKRLNIFRLKDLQKSGLSYERIYLDGYRDSNLGWEVPMIDPLTGEEKFCRTRLDSPGQDDPKYIQPSKTGLLPFFPNLENWYEVFDDSTKSIILTEGEKKASKLIQEGFLAISMPGVSAYGSKTFTESINRIKWKSRNTYLCFDSDIRTKAQVRKALTEFAKILNRKGAQVFEIELPDLSVVSSKGDI